MRYFIKIIFVSVLINMDVLHANSQMQDTINQLDKINSSMQDIITQCKQMEDRNKDDDVDLDFINNLFHQNNKNIQIYLRNS